MRQAIFRQKVCLFYIISNEVIKHCLESPRTLDCTLWQSQRSTPIVPIPMSTRAQSIRTTTKVCRCSLCTYVPSTVPIAISSKAAPIAACACLRQGKSYSRTNNSQITRYSVAGHQRKHEFERTYMSADGSYECTRCHARYSSPSTLKTHMRADNCNGRTDTIRRQQMYPRHSTQRRTQSPVSSATRASPHQISALYT